MPDIVPSTIGSLSVDLIRGLPQALKSRVDTWEVPGLDGYGAQVLGLGNGEFSLVSAAYLVDNAAANDHVSAANAMQGSIISVTDDWGTTYDKILVVEVTSSKMAVINYDTDGSLRSVRVQLQWKMMTCAVDADDNGGGD